MRAALENSHFLKVLGSSTKSSSPQDAFAGNKPETVTAESQACHLCIVDMPAGKPYASKQGFPAAPASKGRSHLHLRRSCQVAAADGLTWHILAGKTAEDNDRLSLKECTTPTTPQNGCILKRSSNLSDLRGGAF